jgi:hypothetical protein
VIDFAFAFPPSAGKKENFMTIRFLVASARYFLQAEGMNEASFDRFHPHSEPGSERARFDEQVKATAKAMSIAVRPAMDRLNTGVSAWLVESDSDSGLELGMSVAEHLGSELEL